MIGDLLYQFGRALGGLAAHPRGGGGAGDEPGPDAAVYDPELGAGVDLEPGENGAEAAQTAVLGTAAAFLLARLLRPRPISWTRVILSGVAATALADFIGRRLEEDGGSDRPPYAEDAGELLARFAAGIAVAAGYAALLYPRLPGPPLFRGLAFGALEIAATPRGGLVRMAHDTPGVRFPLQALAAPVDEDAGPLSHLAFGLGLGLFYRYGPARHDGPDDDDDE